MTYLGKVQGGAVIFEGGEKPKEGSIVRVETIEQAGELSPVARTLLSFSGVVEGLPSDSSVNADHYLYGLPKKE
jgi:hypothetical protein